MNPFKRLIPDDYRKIAQNDSAVGELIAAVYFNATRNMYYIEAMRQLPNGQYEPVTFGPLPAHVFENLSHIMIDVKEMNRKYIYLE